MGFVMKWQSIRTLILGLVLLWVSSIAFEFYLYAQRDVEVFVRDDSRPECLETVVAGKLNVQGERSFDDPDTRHFGDMAELSSLVYAESQPTEYKDWVLVYSGGTESFAKGARYLAGLKFSVWKKESEKLIAVIFRGTDSFIDFHANLHWLTKLLPFLIDQYEQIPEVLTIVEPMITDGYIGISAGHSLGGGLAQHALYQSEKISLSYVFNSTSVTGWTDLDISDRPGDPRVRDTKVYRIHEKGEILEFLRLLTKAGYILSPEPNQHPYFKEYRLNTQQKGLISQHGMVELSYSLNNPRPCDI